MVYKYIIPTPFVDFNGKFVGIYRYTIYTVSHMEHMGGGFTMEFSTQNGPRGGGFGPTCCSVDPTEATTFPQKKKTALLTEAPIHV